MQIDIHKSMKPHSSGFTLVEVLVASVLMAVIGSALTFTLLSGSRSLFNAAEVNQLEEFVDKDLASIRETAFSMTCCSGNCTTDQSTINASTSCTSKISGTQNYYFPSQDGTSDSDTSQTTSFKTACNGNGLITALVTQIRLASPDASVPARITRTFDTSAANRHRLTVVYSSNLLSKAYTLTPTVSAWCP